ncbi:PapD-like protein [Rhodotorula toruloides]
MSVTLNPSSQLGFQRPLTQLVKRTLTVSNHNQSAVAYKVKTTAPKQYCVRPNSGRIEPGETVEVQVLLQPMKEDPPAGAKCRDKFLIQSVIITPERESAALPDLWQAVEKEEKTRTDGQSQIFEQKIRCTYLPAADSDASQPIPEETASSVDASRAGPDASFVSTSARAPSPPQTSGEPASAAVEPPTTSTPPPAAASAGEGTPAYLNPVTSKARDAVAAAGGAVAGAASAAGLTGVASKIEQNTPAPASSARSSPPASSTPSSNTSADEVSRLRSELASAKAEIERLKKQLDAAETASATLRSRGAGAVDKNTAGAGTSQAVVEMKGQEGVPVQVVAGIAFGVFVVTWCVRFRWLCKPCTLTSVSVCRLFF